MITNRQELKEATEEAGALLQEIHDYCEQEELCWADVPEARVRFPRGFIREAEKQRSRLTFVRNSTLTSNMAYTLMLSDSVLWLWLRTDIWGIPKEMLCKIYVFILGALCESITKDYLRGVCGKSYNKRIEFLVKKSIITEELETELKWLWTIRNNMHLFQIEKWEFENEYNEDCHKKAVKSFRGLIHALRTKPRPEFA